MMRVASILCVVQTICVIPTMLSGAIPQAHADPVTSTAMIVRAKPGQATAIGHAAGAGAAARGARPNRSAQIGIVRVISLSSAEPPVTRPSAPVESSLDVPVAAPAEATAQAPGQMPGQVPGQVIVRAERMTRGQKLAHADLLRRYSAESVACLEAISHSETVHRLAPRLLLAIGLVESGRPDRLNGRIAPWPWTINVAGAGYFFDSKQAAITAVQAIQAAGVRSIDVGCMQVNLLQHPHAFATLDDAFDPETNAQYGGRFLLQLQTALGSWPAAAGAYHSMTPDFAIAYLARVAGFWLEAKAFVEQAALSIAAPAGINAMPGSMTRLLAGMAHRDPAPRLDPLHVMTTEFRLRLADEAAQRAARLVAMGLMPIDAGATRRTPATLSSKVTGGVTAQQRVPSLRETLRTVWR